MCSEEFNEQYSSYPSTLTSNTPGSATPSASETMSTTSTLTASLQISSPVYDNMRKSLQDTFTSLGVELARLESENKRLAQHNTAIEKELETSNEHNIATEKELKALREENCKLSVAKDDALKLFAEVEEEKDALQKELDELEELRDVLGWKKKCQELETRATGDRERMETSFKDYQQEMEKRATENQERIQKSMEECRQKMKEHIADVQTQSQNKLEQEINRIKADHTLQMQSLTSAMGFQGLEDMTDGYIVREKPFGRIPGGMIQVSRATLATESEDGERDGPPREDDDSSYLYVARDQYKDFKKFNSLAESIFGLDKDHIVFLKGSKSDFMCFRYETAEVINKWTKEAIMKDRVYILSRDFDKYVFHMVYYVED
ncbi:hypothetical protein BZA77DRAFT_352656 [Pyronema omphalodes]|nr:hypothetical protein BZA77DRAFT_352656 [Pyronema omphalodes]